MVNKKLTQWFLSSTNVNCSDISSLLSIVIQKTLRASADWRIKAYRCTVKELLIYCPHMIVWGGGNWPTWARPDDK